MTDPNFTYLANVVDRSGSMASIRTDAEGGFNQFIADQKKVPGRATIFTAKFDDTYEVEHDHLDLSALTASFTLEPRGMTALLDAIGRTIVEVGSRLEAMPEDERPGHVIFTVTTDGMENRSREFTREQIFSMITEQQDKYGWQFIFLASNQDAIAVGQSMGFRKGSSMTYDSNPVAVASSYGSLSHAVAASRTTGQGINFTDEDRAGASTTSGSSAP